MEEEQSDKYVLLGFQQEQRKYQWHLLINKQKFDLDEELTNEEKTVNADLNPEMSMTTVEEGKESFKMSKMSSSLTVLLNNQDRSVTLFAIEKVK